MNCLPFTFVYLWNYTLEYLPCFIIYCYRLCYRSGGTGNDKTLIASTYETNKKFQIPLEHFLDLHGFAACCVWILGDSEVPEVPEFFFASQWRRSRRHLASWAVSLGRNCPRLSPWKGNKRAGTVSRVVWSWLYVRCNYPFQEPNISLKSGYCKSDFISTSPT